MKHTKKFNIFLITCILFGGFVSCKNSGSKGEEMMILILGSKIIQEAPNGPVIQIGYNDGYNDGYYDGESDGFNDGHYAGYNDYYNSGYNDGSNDGYTDGYTDGDIDGYNDGYDDGWNAGFGYSDSTSSRNMFQAAKELAQKQLETQATYFANKLSLSKEQGVKIAKALNEFKALDHRTEEDMASFAKKVYGVEFGSIMHATFEASAGNNAPLNDVIEEASINFNTSPEHMKSIVKAFHGHVMSDYGISLD